MKRIILCLAVVLGLFAAPVATYAEAPEDNAHAGARVSFDVTTSTTYTNMIHWGPGVSVGGAYYAPFGRLTYFNVGLLFSYNTFKVDGTFGSKYDSRQFKGNIDLIDLRLPLDIGVKFYQTNNVRLSAYTGPHLYFNFSVKGKYDLYRQDYKTPIDEKFSTPGMEIGWGLGVAADIFRHWHIHLEGTYGLSHLGEAEELRDAGMHTYFKRGEISVGFGYNF